MAEELAKRAESTDRDTQIELYKRAACVLRISRFPYLNHTPLKRQAYERQKELYMKGARQWDVPMQDITIPFQNAKEGDGKEIPLYVRVPKGASEENTVPVMFLITGLDGHRPDNWEVSQQRTAEVASRDACLSLTKRTEEALKRGWATVICDIPGVADCPALKTDPSSPDRYFPAILSWIKAQPHFDSRKVAVWGLSAGGYYAIRLAHTQADQLAGSVGHGAGTHHYIGEEWLEHVHHHEYPFSLMEAYLGKYGYGSWDQLLENCQKDYSLVTNGILNQKSCRLLLINGVMDGCMPIEDSMLLAEYGTPKEVRYVHDDLFYTSDRAFGRRSGGVDGDSQVHPRTCTHGLSGSKFLCLAMAGASHGNCKVDRSVKRDRLAQDAAIFQDEASIDSAMRTWERQYCVATGKCDTPCHLRG